MRAELQASCLGRVQPDMEQYRIPSLARACQILELFADSGETMSSSDVARRMKMPRTTALRILLTLCDEGLLSRIGNEFEPGSKLFRLGLRALSSVRLTKLALPILRDLSERTRETAQLVMLSGLQGVVLEVCEGPRLVRVPQPPGTLIALHCSAAGKVLLAYALKSRLPQIVAQGLIARTPNSLTTLAELESELDRILTLGYAVDDEEYYEGVRCLAAPVWEASGATRAALGIVASASTFSRRQNQEVAQHVLSATNELALAMGYEGARPID